MKQTIYFNHINAILLGVIRKQSDSVGVFFQY